MRGPLAFETPEEERAFLIYYAKVLMRESAARRGTAFSHTLAEWAAQARRRIAEMRPRQGDLFA